MTQVHFKHLNVDVRSILDGRLVGRVGLLLKWPKGQCAGDPCAAVIILELGGKLKDLTVAAQSGYVNS